MSCCAPSSASKATTLLVGNGPRRSALEELAADLGLAQRAVFLGDVDDADVRALSGLRCLRAAVGDARRDVRPRPARGDGGREAGREHVGADRRALGQSARPHRARRPPRRRAVAAQCDRPAARIIRSSCCRSPRACSRATAGASGKLAAATNSMITAALFWTTVKTPAAPGPSSAPVTNVPT